MLKKIRIKEIFLTLLGTLMYVLALRLFLIENNIAAGGVSGIAIIINNFVSIPVGWIVFLLNIPILFAAIIINGWKFTASTIIFSIFYSVSIEFFSFIPNIVSDPIVAAIGGGLLYGLGMVLITLGGGSTGGTDLLNRLINKKFKQLSLGKLSLIIDGSIIFLAVLAFRDVDSIIYPLITIFLSSKTCDSILLGLVSGRLCMIITSKGEDQIAVPLMDKIGRSVTLLKGMGMYSKLDKNIFLIGVKPGEAQKIKDIVLDIDSKAFLVLIPVTELIGGNFSSIVK